MPESLFPDGCTCQSYGHGLTMSRVHSPFCPPHQRVASLEDYVRARAVLEQAVVFYLAWLIYARERFGG